VSRVSICWGAFAWICEQSKLKWCAAENHGVLHDIKPTALSSVYAYRLNT
jgi:hypothetical protein